MTRRCSRCEWAFARDDFVRDESRTLEAERRAAQLKGMRFFDYRCPVCGNEDIFVDVVRLDGESPEAFEARRTEMEATAHRLRDESLEVVVVARER